MGSEMCIRDSDNTNVGMMKANLGGKLTLSVELSEGTAAAVRVKKQ